MNRLQLKAVNPSEPGMVEARINAFNLPTWKPKAIIKPFGFTVSVRAELNSALRGSVFRTKKDGTASYNLVPALERGFFVKTKPR